MTTPLPCSFHGGSLTKDFFLSLGSFATCTRPPITNGCRDTNRKQSEVTEGKNTKIDKKMPYTRESLLAEWEEIRPSEPMPIELQNLFLMMFANAPAVRSVDAIVRPCLVQAAAPPPQRYQRRRSAIISQDVAPLGPSEACVIQASTDLRTTISSHTLGPDEDH